MDIIKKELNVCGIYCIQNIVNNKVYIGKAKNIYARMKNHVYNLNKKSKDENRYLIRAWHKYGEENFKCFIVESFEFDEQLLKDKELYWIKEYKALNRKFGYNLRLDSETKTVVHEETRLLRSQLSKGSNNPNYGHKWSDEKKKQMSEFKKQQYKSGEIKINYEASKKGVEIREKLWKEHPELKEQMKENVRKAITKYNIYQYDKDDNLIKIWNCVHDIIIANPTYKKHNIYAVCSGEKPTMYGYKWKKILIDEDIVQTDLKELE